MIIVRLEGGLGNQLFQYAAGRTVALNSNHDLLLDILGFETDTLRGYCLQHFNISQSFATENQVARLTSSKGLKKYVRYVKKKFPLCQGSWVIEKDFRFNPDILNLRGDIYLDGYWQSYKYFENIKDVLKKDLEITTPADGKNIEMATQIKNSLSVSVHIRRGDYVSNPQVNSRHGLCSLEYYKAAIQRIVNAVGTPQFFVFSDDPVWARANLNLNYPVTFCDHNNSSDRHYEDLRLMSLCKHNILANSSFSWWAAWLNANPEKIVFAPERWFAASGVDTSNLIPGNWQRI